MHKNAKGALTLINRGADINSVDFFGWGVLMHALSNDMTDIAETLIQKGCDVNAQATKMKTGLHIVCQNHLIDSIHLLLDYGTNVNIQDGDGDTPLNLYLASIPRDKTPNMEIIKMFLKNECDWTIENKQKQSAIHFALRLGKDGLEIVKLAKQTGFCSPALLLSVAQDPRMVKVFEKYPETKRFVEENSGGTL
ncbi:hypothetical protein LOTGIDRAFT_227887 [Lottia gigantea]|uniref:Ankyrin repeat domain-containing protein 54 n=1 Tax=Lottia gigantea TaxID=225164 RepID=V4CRS8_LOTGI|nr:hypothetical protein LOTGIDRAFT_227887 [Lottia gigantea]ESP05230.1 hypothetical protein LOTGIDRAFT_227887 [Lottia gigantea]